MKFAAILSFVSVALANVAVEKRACAGNNCNRAVTGTRDGLQPASVRSADCASFLKTTVTPAAVTVTATVDPDDASSSSATLSKKDVLFGRQATASPSTLPTYVAAACSGAAAYASACSCFGVTGTVTTAPTPTVTVTTTIDYCDDL
ncbi:hypothetical protein DL546_006335 [Coniochaeta pulveracea]|uniref:Uncharacterized protein n=1 Tax=Coniochaeta pulveracea TaxID=177199 RepID=A0A420Y7Z4_9PEZI|nr:hypothetical protein DL546_006335 [Coniochaeta pulveracea]